VITGVNPEVNRSEPPLPLLLSAGLSGPALILINDAFVREGELMDKCREESHESPGCNGSSGHNGEALFHG
jgi:hypothetical protein